MENNRMRDRLSESSKAEALEYEESPSRFH